MNPITVFIFRVMLVVGGFILLYIVGKPLAESIQYRFTGNSVEGKVIGFRGRGSSKTIFDDNTGQKGKHRVARRPVYRYPITEGSLDSLDGYAKSTVLIPWFNFESSEKVTVVFNKKNPKQSHIFSLGIIITDTLLILLCLYMVKLGLSKRQ
jgi:Protein of unknown function (DUF3592)